MSYTLATMIPLPTPTERRGVGVITYRNGLFAVSRRLTGSVPGAVQLPGGKIEPGEAPIEAAKREFREETGLDLPYPRFLSLFEDQPAFGYSGEFYSASAFVVVLRMGEELQCTEPLKATPWSWVTYDEALNLLHLRRSIEALVLSRRYVSK